MPNHVVFLHGMFMTPRCWDGWVKRFGAAGLTCTAPAWPGREGLSAAELRARHPDPELGKLTLAAVVDHYEAHVRALPEAPVLVGHSMGGLVVQILLARGLGARGVAIDSAPPKGVTSLKWSFIKSNWPVVSPFADRAEPYLPTVEAFRYAFCHTLPLAAARAVWERHVVPESRRVGRGPLEAIARIDFARPRAPLLLIAGALDRIIPASLNRSNFARYASGVELQELPGRTHSLIADEGFAEVADFVLGWLRGEPARATGAGAAAPRS